jgi:hypothetical protein
LSHHQQALIIGQLPEQGAYRPRQSAFAQDVNFLDELIAEPGLIYVMDRAYLDFERLYQMHLDLVFFILRAKSNTQLRRRYSLVRAETQTEQSAANDT